MMKRALSKAVPVCAAWSVSSITWLLLRIRDHHQMLEQFPDLYNEAFSTSFISIAVTVLVLGWPAIILIYILIEWVKLKFVK